MYDVYTCMLTMIYRWCFETRQLSLRLYSHTKIPDLYGSNYRRRTIAINRRFATHNEDNPLQKAFHNDDNAR